jgi:hypothetical protein
MIAACDRPGDSAAITQPAGINTDLYTSSSDDMLQVIELAQVMRILIDVPRGTISRKSRFCAAQHNGGQTFSFPHRTNHCDRFHRSPVTLIA